MENENVNAEQTANENVNQENENGKATETENVNSNSTSEAKFTQAQVDDLIAKRLARETKKFEKKLEEAKKSNGTEPTDAEKITDLQNKLNESQKVILKYKLAKFSADANVKADRAEAFSRLIDLTDVDLSDDEALKDAVAETAKAYPEFLGKQNENSANETKGFIKAGAEKKDLTEEEKMRNQIRKAFGLK